VKRSRLVFGGAGVVVAAIAVIAIATTGGASSSHSASASHASTSAPAYAPTTVPAPVTTVPAPAPAVAPAPAAVAHVAHDARLGDILVSGTGRTVYLFEQDMGTISACTGACANTWAPWMTNGAPTGGPGVDAALLGSAHGQVTYAGHLLYFFAGDHVAGDTNGVAIPSWDAISATGMQVGH
jgi:predicted lipoprotein with Yx(FWY)xxD motif